MAAIMISESQRQLLKSVGSLRRAAAGHWALARLRSNCCTTVLDAVLEQSWLIKPQRTTNAVGTVLNLALKL